MIRLTPGPPETQQGGEEPPPAESVTVSPTVTVTLTRAQAEALIWASEQLGFYKGLLGPWVALLGAKGILRTHLEGKAP